MRRILDGLAEAFECLPLTPPGWPAAVWAAMAGEAVLARWPRFPPAATMPHGRLGHGRGRSVDEARHRAIGELVEIASCCAWGDEPLVEARLASVRDRAWSPAALAGFSPAQRRDRAAWNERLAGLDWIPPETHAERPIAWMEAAVSGSSEAVLVPADAVLIGRRNTGDDDAAAVADTNGCAAGETLEAAMLSAVYELVERDATGRWWYGKRARHRIAASGVEAAETAAEALARRRRSLWLIDITTDLGIPTAAALAADAESRHVAVGFASRSSLSAAAAEAVIELMQTELRVMLAVQNPGLAPDLDPWFREVDIDALPRSSEPAGSRQGEPARIARDDLSLCLAALEGAGCRIAFLDMTRSEFRVPVIRAISPDLCHWKPRFGRARLLAPDYRDIGRAAKAPHRFYLRI